MHEKNHAGLVPAIWVYGWLRYIGSRRLIQKEKEQKAIDTKWYVAFVASRPHGSTNMAAGKKEMVDDHNARTGKRKRQVVVCFKRDSCVVVIVVE